MLKKISYTSLIFTLFLGSCETDKKQVIQEDITFEEISDYNKEKIKDLAFSMPSPMEIAIILNKANAIYMQDLMNPTENESIYNNSSYITALNLGIYGADLGYACAYTNVSDAFSYLRVSKNLADQLGVLGAFENELISRFDNNLDNPDSIMTIIGQSFHLTDKFLKENERANVSALIIAGGWIEGLYLSTKIVERYPTNMNEQERKKILDPITKSIAEQKPSLDNLINLLEIYKNNKEIEKLSGKLKDLQKIYTQVTYEELGYKESVKNGVTFIENETKVEINSATLAQITLVINNIRNSLTKGVSS